MRKIYWINPINRKGRIKLQNSYKLGAENYKQAEAKKILYR